jgi:hypothetical protein
MSAAVAAQVSTNTIVQFIAPLVFGLICPVTTKTVTKAHRITRVDWNSTQS